MLLILTDTLDKHADFVISKLSNNTKYFRLNLDVESLKNTKVTYSNNVLLINIQSVAISTDDIQKVWCRRSFVEIPLEYDVGESVDFKIWKNEWNATLIGLYTILKNKKWLNNISDALKGENKYYQMQLARKVGLLMPDTIVSNQKNKLISFMKTHNDDCVFKLINQNLYVSKDKTVQGLYTNRISTKHLKDFQEGCENPILLQEYIEKQYEVRWTVVNGEHFVCKIDSQKSQIANEDWRRYDLAQTPHVAMKAPIEIKNIVNKLMHILKLGYGALDFIVDPSGKWYFLEINCMGQWLWIENLTGLKISDAIIKWIEH
ncbi:hypothetical protein [Helicobacter sp. 11S02629-2]|uniref:MvdC/MvdD family ATP grasp protein n=1 Tax=Helicobacter sp. 11S02629-2 TaxID=1476195 RepID=UPI000BA59B1B|nr:hypothetical protein [Helicobacter sp. 11S02629-2]PAF43126.1 hypothetical protein BKH40_07380 [Helicobacter sp. 11S02629-2]